MGDIVEPEETPEESTLELVDNSAPDSRATLAALDETVAILAADMLGGA